MLMWALLLMAMLIELLWLMKMEQSAMVTKSFCFLQKCMILRSCFEMVAEVCYMDFSRQFHLWKRERSRSYVTDEKGENGRKGRVNNKSNYFKTASKLWQ